MMTPRFLLRFDAGISHFHSSKYNVHYLPLTEVEMLLGEGPLFPQGGSRHSEPENEIGPKCLVGTRGLERAGCGPLVQT